MSFLLDGRSAQVCLKRASGCGTFSSEREERNIGSRLNKANAFGEMVCRYASLVFALE
jgi:hypothetical protein